jgi:hypothetical protein
MNRTKRVQNQAPKIGGPDREFDAQTVRSGTNSAAPSLRLAQRALMGVWERSQTFTII